MISTKISSVIDAEGNEYPLSRYALRKESGEKVFSLYTKLFKDVPIKCSYTFSGVDKTPLIIKRFDFPYRAGRANNNNAEDGKVFFVDLPVTWK